MYEPPHRSPLVPLLRVAAIVALGDLMTKQVALLWIGALEPKVSSFIRFGVVHNDKGAFGLTAGNYTWEVSLALTLAALVLIVPVARDLAGIDQRAPVALGLIAGGAFGNLVSLLLSPAGVVDFIALQRADGAGIVLNVADIGAYAGVAMLMRTTAMVIAAIRQSRQQPAVTDESSASAMPLKRLADLELVRVVARDGSETTQPVDGGSSPTRPGADRQVHLQIIHADGAPSRPGSTLAARLRESTGGTRGAVGAAYLRPMSHGADLRTRR
ncbi:MAG TPA: signal peptidase II [Gemmatimonadaceae bacterium]|nr:signal peptidase II [Gemmatimonadaceae bacterium]